MNKRNNICFFSVIFEENKNYLNNFLLSLSKQSFKNFDIIIVNDGLKNFNSFKKKYHMLNILELKFSNTPIKNREFGLDFIKKKGYKIIILGDSDDYFENNRVQVCVEKLKKYDIVVNDLSLFNSRGVFRKNYFSSRIKNNTKVSIDFIRERNIFGMSNSALNSNILNNIKISAEVIAYDWFLFSQLLLKNNLAIFTNETSTFYRQHKNNIIGIGDIENNSIIFELEVKLKHYGILKNIDKKYKNLYYETQELHMEFKRKTELKKFNSCKIKNPFWWEKSSIFFKEYKNENQINGKKRNL